MSSHPTKPSLSLYLSEIGAYPVLRKEEARQVAREARSGDHARTILVQSNLRLAVRIAVEYQNLGVPLEDLINEGNLGLLEAARRYDPGQGTTFATYAIWWVRKFMLKALAEQAGQVRIPSSQRRKVRALSETTRGLRQALGRQPQREELSSHMRWTLDELDGFLQMWRPEVSLDESVGDRERPLSESLADTTLINAEDALLRTENIEWLRAAVSVLSEQDQTVLEKRFGLAGGRKMTLREISAEEGVSRERIRQIESRALRKLRKAFASRRRPRPGKPLA